MSQQVVIVGGGIIGIASAWYLRKAGFDVVVLDRGRIGGACSHGNCGLVCPSHVLPLTEPGAFKNAIKSMLSPSGAFRVKPRMDPALWSWMWKFAKRCNTRDMLEAATPMSSLLTSSMSEYETWVSDEAIDCEWQKKGLLFVYKDPKQWNAFEATNAILRDQFNEPARQLDTAQTTALEPALLPSVAGSWHYEHDAHLRPDRLVNSLRERLEADGVEFREQCEFLELVGSANTTAMQTTLGELAFDHCVFACGAWSPKLNQRLGIRIPIEPGKGYSLTMPRPANCPDIPMIFPEHRVAVTPMKSAYRLGSIMEFAGWNEEINPKRLEMLKSGAKHYLCEPYSDRVEETWFGWRPMTPDSLPIIDRCPGKDNVWLATGHNMLGLSMAPGTGKLVAELISGATPHVDCHPYRFTRW